MRVALVAPGWGNSWIPLIKAEVERRGHEFEVVRPNQNFSLTHDVYIHAWASGDGIRGKRNVMFMRRYELFSGALANIVWTRIDDLILVNSWIKDVVDKYFKSKGIQTRTHLVYNAVDTSKWTYKDRKPNNRIGMACHVHPKKNLPLALEVLSHLPEEFELHIAGEIQDACTAEYLNHMGKKNRRTVYLYGHIPREQLDLWWEQMGFCLSTSLSEGNPNNVLEAMAKGIKPVVLNWPGAEDQLPEEWRGNSARELADLVVEFDSEAQVRTVFETYSSASYRKHVEEFYSLDNIRRAVDIALNTQEQT